MRRLLLGGLTAILVLAGVTPAVAAGRVMPVAGPVVGAFDPPDVKWGPGHRGVDVAAEPGTVVVAPAAGTVTFAGMVAGRPVLVISHGDTRTTLEPVTATVAVGTAVAAGQQVGVLEAGHQCDAPACLHWGLLRGQTYLNPLSGTPSPIRLLAESDVAAIKKRALARSLAAAGGGADGPLDAGGILMRPVPGRVSSGFGRRFHPIFKEWRMHAGIDLSAGCGTPIRAAGDGRVTHVGYDSSGGWRLIVSHSPHKGRSLQTVYLHAQGYSVRPGARVTRGQVVGTVGSTGWSTGCHLHFSVKLAGNHVDPMLFL